MMWTAEQIAALAPDAASLTAARKLHGKWRDTGRNGSALWGLCQGSGSSPYRTVVDLDGPAYKCSCPSRKFPCKHALSLLQTWSDGAVGEVAEPADFAAEWLRARAAKPAPKAARTSREATVEQRRSRVAAGLADLEIWLCDQVRTGLAQADRSFGAFEGVAKRMVDAQAPGVAAALRQLPRNVVLREDWPALLLREYGRLHLLAAAHRHLDELGPGLAAAARAHIGYPAPAESVRAEPAVRDQWMVLGQRITEDERLYTRRVWARGRRTGRWAVLVDHSFGSPAFPPDTPGPGFMSEANLHFYPGAAALRALWGERLGAQEPFTSIPSRVAAANTNGSGASEGARCGTLDRSRTASAVGISDERLGVPGNRSSSGPGNRTGEDSAASRTAPPSGPGTIAAALAEHARALSADPWLRSWPVLLADVVPVVDENRWYVAEFDGTALPLARLAEQPWPLLGVSGGHPITVIGEWTADGLVPVSAFADGDIVDAGADSIGTASPAPAGDLTSAALLGTARRVPETAGLPGPVAAAARTTGDPAAALLEIAVLQDTFERGGTIPSTTTLPDPAGDDERPLLPKPAGYRLTRLLAERSPFLPEWFEAAARHDYRAPDALCAALLDHAKTQVALREPLIRLAGVRGAWLARHAPHWHALVRADPESADVWSHGRPAERRAWLAALRARDPRAARETLAASWRTEPGPVRAELLAVLAVDLTPDDEPLLESALDDARAEVRRTAADLLARLTDSAFARRMEERVTRWITLAGDRMSAHLPHALDDAARRDGLADRTGATAFRLDGAPDVAAEWLRRTVAATPLPHWDTVFATPERAVRIRMADEMLGPIFAGWADAALAQRDSRWAATLFEVLTATPTLGADLELRRELFALLPLAERVRYLRRLDSNWLADVELLVRAVPRPWPRPLAEHLLHLLFDRAQLAAARPGAAGRTPASYRTLFRTAAVHFPADAAGAVTATARRCGDPAWQNTFDQLAHDLAQRTTMLEELQ
ncbi:hypothetical protein BJY24_001236 [Nocardia transvalensis]|uniref:SWIM-type domain-containing protein n=1 Tax=Nocardia transvalensis TaxID=37333 RepID=A0A7W9PA91_9NOCA|nr:SWIM zinc finger family protein [Nocardia transvalensis]MBB5912369.1 hypothetical protein [Nocardia transvalensis]